MATFKRINELPLADTIEDSDLLILETATGTKAVTREVLKGETSISKEDVGLGNVDNTSDLNKPISTATQTALNAKVDTATLTSNYSTNAQIASTYLSQNAASGTYLSKTDAAAGYVSKSNHTTDLATKQDVINDLATIRSGASAGATALQPGDLADVATSGSYTDLIDKPTYSTVASTGSYNDLLNKPSLANVATSGAYSDLTGKPTFATVATSGAYSDLTGKPTIPDAQIQADWSEADNTKKDYIKNKPSLHAVATSGSYNDLINKPTLSSVAISGSYTDLFNKPTIPSKVSDLDNDTGYITGIAWNDVANKPVDFTPSSHNHVGSEVTLTGYEKASSASAVAATDTVNQALGKIEKALDGKQASGSYAAAVHEHTVSDITDFPSIPSQPSDIGAAAVSHDHVGSEVTLTGYEKASSASAVAATDTVNEALGKIEKALDGKQASGSYAPATHTHVGSAVTLTGYEKASSASAVATTDTVNEAIGKIEKALDGKQASGSYAAAVHTHVGSDTVLTGYEKASSASAVATTDTVNQAIGKLEKALDGKQASGTYLDTTSTYNTLNTSNQTIIGAINEVNGYLSGLEALLAEI